MNNKKKPQTREEKIAYLNGLKNGNRSLSEITEPNVIFLEYRDDQPGIVLIQNTGKYVTVEETEALKAKWRANGTFIWIEELTGLADDDENRPANDVKKATDEV